MPSRNLLGVACAAALCLLTCTASGVIVAGGDGTQNTTAPADDFGLSDIASFNGASGVYLGNGWIITGYHVVGDATGTGFNLGGVSLDGGSYTADPNSGVRLLNADRSPADLALFRLTAVPPGLAGARIATVSPALGTAVSMAGNGLNRQPSLTRWNVDNSVEPNQWTVTTTGRGDAQGYYYGSGNSLRWGTNITTAFPDGPAVELGDDGHGTTQFFRTQFTSATGSGQAAAGDSGGGVFDRTATGWELSGVMLAIDAADGQPSSTAVFGDSTYAGDLASYSAQILATVPEPGTFGFALALLPLFARRRRKCVSRA